MTTTPPQALLERLRSTTRQQTVLNHEVTVGLDWWNEGQLDLVGLPVTAAGQTTGRHPLSRQEIFQFAGQAAVSTEGALRLLWHTLAWGTGRTQRGNRKRIVSISVDTDHYGELLRQAAVLSATDPQAAFKLLRPRRRNAISGLGPGFFTKYLYFAGGGEPDHPCVIVDSVVRSTLHKHTGDEAFAPKSQYPAHQYTAALETMRGWAEHASDQLGRPVALDEVEKWAFQPRASSELG